MVLEVCRQIVGDGHHAEDAFQAVFLVLASKAGAIRDPDLLGTWLYGVTIRTARRSRARLVRLRRREEGDAMRCPGPESRVLAGSSVESAEESAIGREQAEALHDEIDRLPPTFRLPVVLSYFEGLTLDEVARRLHWPAGTVRSRLARARDKLHRGLTRRGVVLPAAAIAAALGHRPAAASVSSALCDTTTRAALRFVAGQAASASASALAREVLRSMLLHRSIMAAPIVLGLAAVVAGAGLLGRSLTTKDEPNRGDPAPRVAVTAPARPGEMGKTQPPSPPGASSGADRADRVAARLSPWGERVERSIREGVRFLKQQQRPDGSWPDIDGDSRSGYDQPGPARPARGRREARFPGDSQGPRVPPGLPSGCPE